MTGQTQQAPGAAPAAATGNKQLIAEGLARPRFFDGQYLNASLLTAEQLFHRQSLLFTQLAGGVGIGYGLSLSLSPDGRSLRISPGVGFTSGRLVVLEREAVIDLQVLNAPNPPLGKSQPATEFTDCAPAFAEAPSFLNVAPGSQVYVVELCPGEAEEGTAEVFGLRCKDACSSTLESPSVREHVRISLKPLSLDGLAAELAKLPGSGQASAFRSRLASAWFRAEDAARGSLLGRVGLRSDGWCGAAPKPSLDCLPLGLLIGSGSAFEVDQWIARRERIDPPARRHWLGAMKMRPYQDYLAQILQFQCQLADRLGIGELDGLSAASDDAELIERVASGQLSEADRERLVTRLRSRAAWPRDRSGQPLLSELGFVELPPAGFLPVVPDAAPINEQVRRWFGDLADLEFIGVREDELGDAVESAQHRNRIRLGGKETVQILIPGGRQAEGPDAPPNLYTGTVILGQDDVWPDGDGEGAIPSALLMLEAVARVDVDRTGVLTFGMLGVGMRPTREGLSSIIEELGPYLRDGEVDHDGGIVAISELKSANKGLAEAVNGRTTDNTNVLVIVWMSLQIETVPNKQGSMSVSGLIDVTEVGVNPRSDTIELDQAPAAVSASGGQLELKLPGPGLERIGMTFTNENLTNIELAGAGFRATNVAVTGALHLEAHADDPGARSTADLEPTTLRAFDLETVLGLHESVRGSRDVSSLARSILTGSAPEPSPNRWITGHDYVLFTRPFAS